MTVIELPDDQAAALKARAAAEGLSLEEWLARLAATEPPVKGPLEAVAKIILANMRKVPPEIMAAMPADGASQIDHYVYGLPKREE